MTDNAKKSFSKTTLAAVLLLLLALLFVGCNKSQETKDVSGAGDAEAEEFDGHVVLNSFELDLDVKSFKSGHVMLEVINDGDIRHELAVYKTDLKADDLPMNTKLKKVDSGGEGVDKISEVIVEPATAAHWGAELIPGRYVAICNFPGHFAKGMIKTFEVR